MPDLPGYVGVGVPMYGECQIHDASQDDDVAHMFLQIPGNYGRDHEDLVVERRGGEDWMRWASSLYRPLATVPALAAGANVVPIGADGYAEWRAVAAATTLHITGASRLVPLRRRVREAGEGRGAGAAADVSAPAGSYLVVFGPAGASPDVTLTP